MPGRSRKTYAAGTTRKRSVIQSARGGSAGGVAVAGLLLGEVLGLVDLVGVLPAGLVVGEVTGLLDGSVDLLVVLVHELLRVVQESHVAPRVVGPLERGPSHNLALAEDLEHQPQDVEEHRHAE